VKLLNKALTDLVRVDAPAPVERAVSDVVLERGRQRRVLVAELLNVMGEIEHEIGGREACSVSLPKWTNPHGVDLTKPYIYYLCSRSTKHEYRYVGKGKSSSRMSAYWRNVQRALEGETKRPAIKRDGTPQSDGNIRYRYVHLILAAAVRNGWDIEHYPLENCDLSEHSARERALIAEKRGNMNDGASWYVEDFESLVAALL